VGRHVETARDSVDRGRQPAAREGGRKDSVDQFAELLVSLLDLLECLRDKRRHLRTFVLKRSLGELERHDGAHKPLLVSCASPSAWTAVGHFTDAAQHQYALAERFDGNTWTAQTVPSPPSNATGRPAPALASVSCSSVTDCVAVGYYEVPTTLPLVINAVATTLAERWDGTSLNASDGTPTYATASPRSDSDLLRSRVRTCSDRGRV
jgi:hypothetical protein